MGVEGSSISARGETCTNTYMHTCIDIQRQTTDFKEARLLLVKAAVLHYLHSAKLQASAACARLCVCAIPRRR